MGRQGDRVRLARPALRIRRAPAPVPAADAAPTGFDLRQLGANRAVRSLVQLDPVVVGADHASEREATRAERSPVRGADRTAAPRGTGGTALAEPVRRSMEEHTGADLSGLRVHTDPTARRLADSLGAEAVSHGGNVFFGTGSYAPGTRAGRELLAHEATHAVAHDPAQVHLKRSKQHLDFVRMKRKETHITRMLAGKALRAMGADEKAERIDGDDIDHYGHWWVEVGSLSPGGQWEPKRSYGWWPEDSVNIKQTLKIERMEGKLNQGDANDPHHGDDADIEFHPVMEVDDNADYDTVAAKVLGDIDSFAHSFKGSWNWRLGWGKNCHTFQDRMKKKLGLHHQKSKKWFSDPNAQAKIDAANLQAQTEAEEAAKNRHLAPWKFAEGVGGMINAVSLPIEVPDGYFDGLTKEQFKSIADYIECTTEELGWYIQGKWGAEAMANLT